MKMFCKQFNHKISTTVLQGLNRNGKRFFGNRIRTYEEVRIPVPWGYIAGKWWGSQNKRPILAIHGWQDNSGTFDLLVPQLQSGVSVLAVDFPGHGLSSYLPAGMYYHPIDSVITIRRLVQYFNWDKVSLMGHSMGGIVSHVYSILYPNTIDFVICMDGVKPLVFEDHKLERMINNAEKFLKYDTIQGKNEEPPNYSFEEMEKMLHEASRKSINMEKARYILERNIAPSKKQPNRYYFSRDLRLKVGPLLDISQKDSVQHASKAIYPLLLLKFTGSGYIEKKEQTMEFLDIIKKNNKNLEMYTIEGTHHTHLNNPERVSGVINDFIKKYNVYDRSEGGIKEDIKIRRESHHVEIPS